MSHRRSTHAATNSAASPTTRPGAIVIEVRAAMGGADASLFAGELLRAYLRLAERRGWKADILERHAAGRDGVREAAVMMTGAGVDAMSAEAGTHRVQRQPVTDRGGRRHTSAATVAALPVAASAAQVIDAGDVRIDTFRSSGAGGQNVQKTETAVRATHLPTGLTASVQDERSQSANKTRALDLLASRVMALREAKTAGATRDMRRAMVGSGHIAERVRTYAYREGVVTDHRSGVRAPLGDVLAGGFEIFSAA